MCVIIDNRDGKDIPVSIIERSYQLNRDGYGRLHLGTGEIVRTSLASRAKELAAENVPAIHHFRLSSVGGVHDSNIHPFPVRDGWVLFMNGTVNGMRRATYRETDTERIAHMLKEGVHEDNFADVLSHFDARFVVANAEKQKVIRTGEWVEHEGCHYSKSDVLADELVAVYGTLRRTMGNHHIIAPGTFVGKGLTKHRYRMQEHGCPYVFPVAQKEGKGHHIVVEVYRVNKALLQGPLDSLEGYPHHYTRSKFEITLEKGVTVNAWLYHPKTAARLDKSKPLLSDYVKETKRHRSQLFFWNDRKLSKRERDIYRELMGSNPKPDIKATVPTIAEVLEESYVVEASRTPGECEQCDMPLSIYEDWRYCEYCGWHESTLRGML